MCDEDAGVTRDYRLVARLKNNRLWEAITTTYPSVRTQSDAARAMQLDPGRLGELINMAYWPRCPTVEWGRTHGKRGQSCTCRDGWFLIAWKVADAVFEEPHYLFDRVLYGQRPTVLDMEVDRPEMVALVGRIALPGPDQEAEANERHRLLQDALASLSSKEQTVLRGRFGLDGEERALKDIADEFGITRERIRQIEARALRLLRHPDRNRGLAGAL